MYSTECIPKSIICIHLAIMNLTIVRTIIFRFIDRPELCQLAGEKQCTIQTGIKDAPLFFRTSLHTYTIHNPIPSLPGRFSDFGQCMLFYFTVKV